MFESVLKMITIKGSYVGYVGSPCSLAVHALSIAILMHNSNRKDTAEALEFYRRGLIKAPFKVVGLSELQKVYDLMHKGQIAGRYVLDTSK